MNQAIKKTKEKVSSERELNPMNLVLCKRCGGNGYMKTNPNCYHTCLVCLGRGSIHKAKSTFI